MKRTSKTLSFFLALLCTYTFIASAMLCAAEPSPAVIPKHALSPTKRPNILFIFADDFAYDALGYAGNKVVQTPNLDRLAAASTSFTHAYNMGSWSGAVCVASRAMLNTGRFVWQAKKVNYKKAAKEHLLWSQQFEKAGYHTYMTGKWHVNVDPNNCFHQTSKVRPGMPPGSQRTHPHAYNRPKSISDTKWKPWNKKEGGYWLGGKHWSEVTADEGIAFMQQKRPDGKPFFIYLAFNAPHDPRQSPKRFVDMYPPKKVDLPSGFQPEYPYKDAMGCGKSLRDEALAPFPRTEYAVKVHRGEYYALITHLDLQIARVLEALKKSGQADNTLVVFTADHGLACGHHGLMGKQNMYEHSMRVPFLVRGPGFPAGKKIATPIYLQDAVPTTLEAAGIDIPKRVQFKSLSPLVRGETQTHYAAIYGAYLNRQRMIRKDDWKLIYYPKADVYRLYNLKADPQELNDLAKTPEAQPRLKELQASLRQLQQEMGDPLLETANN